MEIGRLNNEENKTPQLHVQKGWIPSVLKCMQ